MPHFKALPDAARFGDLRVAFPEPMDHLVPFAESLMSGPGPLTLGEREMIAAYVSGLNACRYCFGTHVQAARAHGVDPDILEAALADPASVPFGPGWAEVLTLVRKQTEAPSRIVQGDIDAALEAGWSEDAVTRSCLIGAYYNMLNRIVDAFGIVADEGYYREAGERLAGVARAAQARFSDP